MSTKRRDGQRRPLRYYDSQNGCLGCDPVTAPRFRDPSGISPLVKSDLEERLPNNAA